jgi:glycosyltransferase involved in cell wall biosynthesis
MRVLHLLDHSAPRRSDYSRRAQALLQGLRSHGVHTVHLTGPRHAAGDAAGNAAAAAPDGWHFYRTALPAGMEGLARHAPRLGAAARTAALALRLRQVARLTRPDLIHVHLPSWNALAALPVAHLARLPLVVEADRRAGAADPPPPALQAWLERRALDRAHAIAAGTAQVRASLRADGVGGKRITVIPPAPDLPACRSASAIRTGLGPPGLEGAPLLAYAGGSGPLDGLELLLAAFAVLRRTYPALRLVVAGDGDGALAERTGARDMRGHVVVTGALSYRRAADLLPRADIAVFPTLHAAGALSPSRHLLNAMAQGCAIVASDTVCHRELLVHGHSGILFQAGSRNALAEAMAGLLAEPWRLAALGAAAAEFIQGRRSWDLTARRYRRLYETVLAQNGKQR